MKYGWIIFSSVTFAERVSRAARQSLKHCLVRQTPSSISQSGCSYGVRCYQTELNDIIKLSRQLNITIKKIYREETQNGEVVYIPYDLSG